MRAVMEDVGLADPQLLARRQEFPDGITVAIQSIFPGCINQQIYNTLALRQLVPQGTDKCELHWTLFRLLKTTTRKCARCVSCRPI